ncbi:hypothetical protein [Bacillus wiedmannii]|uniref:hypothetical protein n=1 Tax=Bacillus wiedmannii TaxID=1890302 RepID=UPI000BF17257|nr:hypothetical protein [Bacillus wiedmannii]PEM08496.1 hypothetical protein CN610_19785 [Bacillus wiedmannii]
MAQQKATCPRCGGKGVIPQYFYNRKGICFLCWGSGHVMITVPAGKDKDSYIKELQKEEAERFKKHPPKVAMPDKKDQRNKEYFKGAKQGKVEPDGDAKPGGSTAKPKPDAKPKPGTGTGTPDPKPEPQTNVKERNDKRKDAIAALGIDTSRNGGDIWNAVAAKYKTDGRFRGNFKVLEMAKAINKKDRKDGFRSADLITEAYIMAKLGEAVGGAEGMSADMKEKLKQIPPEKREDLKKSLSKNFETFHTQASNMITGILETGDAEMLDAVGLALKGALSAGKMLQDVDAVPYEGSQERPKFADRTEAKRYMEEKFAAAGNDKAKLKALQEELESEEMQEYRAAHRISINISNKLFEIDDREVRDVLSKLGISRKASHERTEEDYEKSIAALEALKDNEVAQRTADSHRTSHRILKGRRQVKEWREKYNVDNWDASKEELSKARAALVEIEDPATREAESKRLAVAEKRVAEQEEHMRLLQEAVAMNKELDAKRKAASENKQFADTPIGRKIAGMVGDGVKDDTHAREIGKVAAAEFEKNITRFSEVSWEEFAKSNKEVRDKLAELQAAADEYNAANTASRDPERREEHEALQKRLQELKPIIATISGELSQARVKVGEQQVHIAEAKERAYLETLSTIRETGFDVGLRFDKEKGKYRPGVASHIAQHTRFFPNSWVDVSNQNEMSHTYHLKRAMYTLELKPRVVMHNGKPMIYSKEGSIFLSGKHPSRVIVHELAHRMETTNPSISNVLRKYYNRVTKGQEEIWLGTSGGNYEKDELYRKKNNGKDWINPYMGKDYKEQAWELLSMSMESIIFDNHHNVNGKRLEFDDRETYETIWGVIAGA